jgi:serpin B
MRGDGYRAVDLWYRGGDFAMLVLLPDRRDGLAALEARLSPEMLDDCIRRLRERRVRLYLPRFTLTWGTSEISGALQAMGMELPFTIDADFSAIMGGGPREASAVRISQVYHKAWVEVNEEGTEAAAATAVTFVTLSSMAPPPPDPVFLADHPFLFAIRHRGSGAILFLGRLVDPGTAR